MTWSDAARRAAALARKSHSMTHQIEYERHRPVAQVHRMYQESRGSFHEYGTPKFDAYYTSSEARRKAASAIRGVRNKLRKGGTFDWHSDKQAIQNAAYTSSMKHHALASPRQQPQAGNRPSKALRRAKRSARMSHTDH